MFPDDFEHYQTLLGPHRPKDVSDKEGLHHFRVFKKRMRENCDAALVELTSTDLCVYFCDFLLFALPDGFWPKNYFDYELYRFEPQERMRFLGSVHNLRVRKCFNPRDAWHLVEQKAELLERLHAGGVLQREWVIPAECTADEFVCFAQRNPVMFVKSLDRKKGHGAHRVDARVIGAEALYQQCCENNAVCEQAICQHGDMAELCPDSVNTMRVVTLRDVDGGIQVPCAALRIGRVGQCVDHRRTNDFLTAVVSVQDGIVCSPALTNNHDRLSHHPDTSALIAGRAIPAWDAVISCARTAHQLFPELGYIGWDIAVREDGNAEVVDADCYPDMTLVQAPSLKGVRDLFVPLVRQMKRAHKVRS